MRPNELAQVYLEVAVEFYEEDGDAEALLLAMRDVAKGQKYYSQLCQRY